MRYLLTFLISIIFTTNLNALEIEISIGELFDKISILEIKKQKIQGPSQNEHICQEYKMLANASQSLPTFPELLDLLDQLNIVNVAQWELQEKVREAYLLKNSEISKYGSLIYPTNQQRLFLKKAIDQLYFSKFNDERKILVEISPGELLDRISILKLKKQNHDLDDDHELEKLEVLHKNLSGTFPKIEEFYKTLLNLNTSIWKTQTLARSLESRSESQEFVDNVVLEFKLNDIRFCVKYMINESCNSKFFEEKSY